MHERTAETGEHGNFIPPTDREKSINELYHSFMQFEEPQHLVVFTDSDHAGCLRTRKSTSSFKIMYGQHLPRSASSTQAVISLRSGESEFYSLVKGVAAGLGAAAMLRDLGVELTGDATVEVKVDATAGRGVAMRRGAGRIRHIATPTLWVQKLVQDGKVKVSKIPGNANPADLGSKAFGCSFDPETPCAMQVRISSWQI